MQCKKQKHRLQFRSTHDVACNNRICTSDENQSTTDLIPGFAGNIDVVKEKTNRITSIPGEGKKNITGSAPTKKEFKEILADAIMQVCDTVNRFQVHQAIIHCNSCC